MAFNNEEFENNRVRVIYKALVPQVGVARSEQKQVSLGTIWQISVQRQVDAKVLFNGKMHRIYETFEWCLLNSDGENQDHYVEIILDPTM